MLIIRFIILFWVTTEIGLNALVLKLCMNREFQTEAGVLSETLCSSCCLFKVPPPRYLVCSYWPAHTRLSQHCSLCLQSALLCLSFTSNRNIVINCANLSLDAIVGC